MNALSLPLTFFSFTVIFRQVGALTSSITVEASVKCFICAPHILSGNACLECNSVGKPTVRLHKDLQ